MPPTPSEIRRNYVEQYRGELQSFQRRALLAELAVKEAVGVTSLDIHAVFSRPKDAESLRLKMVNKSYTDPGSEITDKVGVRVITYYASDVDRVVGALKRRFEVDPTRSVDKRQELGLRDFGYRSVHLVVRLKSEKLEYRELATEWFEIQVRSILEHAWAEIEHEIVYKSKIAFPPAVKRSFAMLSGVLELLDNQFDGLREKQSPLIDAHLKSYSSKLEGEVELDSARLLAFFECNFPDGLSWRKAVSAGVPFPARIEAKCLAALKLASITTADELKMATGAAKFKAGVKVFADKQGLPAEGVSHLALAVLSIATRDPKIVEEFFPDMKADLAFASALDALSNKTKSSGSKKKT